jgi:predicted nucleic acid-binding protein
MTPVLFDASVYIRALRQGHDHILQTRSVAPGAPLWLSAVVLEELLAGADTSGRKALQHLQRTFEQVGRVLVPNLNDWSRTGQLLARFSAESGYEKIGRGRLTNDVLISTSAARQGIVVLTVNIRDFRKIAKFCPLQWALW